MVRLLLCTRPPETRPLNCRKERMRSEDLDLLPLRAGFRLQRIRCDWDMVRFESCFDKMAEGNH